MKKFYSYVVLMLVALLGLSASATTVKVNVDNKARVDFGYNYKMYGFLDMKTPIALENDGENIVEVSTQATSLYVAPTSGSTIQSVAVNGSSVEETGWSAIAITEGMEITITSGEAGAAGNIIFTTDNIGRVALEMRGESGSRAVTLDASPKAIPFYADDNALAITSADNNNPIIKVKVDGQTISKGFGGWVVQPLVDNMKVEAITDPGSLTKYQVSFNFIDDNARSYITGATVNNEPVEAFAAGFEAAEDATVQLSIDSSVENVKVKVNGEVQTASPLSGIIFTVTGNTSVEAYTEQPQVTPININLDNAAAVEVGYKEDYQHPFYGTQERSVEISGLNDGLNSVNAGETWKCLYVKIKDSMYELVSVTVDGAAVPSAESIAIVAGMTLKVTTQHIAETGSVQIKCDDYTRVGAAVRGESGERQVTLASNDETVAYYPGEYAVVISSLDSQNPVVKVTANGNAVSGNRGTFVVEPISNNMQIVVTTVPTLYNVKFQFGDDNARAYVTNVKVGGVEKEGYDAPEGFEVAENTSVSVNVNTEITNVVVYVNDVEKAPVTLPGLAFINFDVTGNTVVRVETVQPEVFNVNLDHAAYVNVGWMKPHSIIPGLTQKTLFEGLVDGDNTIEIPSGCTSIFVEPANETYTIKSVTRNGDTVSDYSTIAVEPGTQIVVISDNATGIQDIIGAVENVTVYNLQGMPVLSNAPAAAVSNLPAGIYIVNGVKIMKR